MTQFAFRPDMADEIKPVQGVDPRSMGAFQPASQTPKSLVGGDASTSGLGGQSAPQAGPRSTYSLGREDGGDPRGMESFVRQTAMRYGVDPDVAMRVARSEGLSNPLGDKGSSFGAFQLHTGGGLGDEFRRDTGLDPADPTNERATIDYSLRRASQEGWGPWHGAARVGVGRFEGVPLRDNYARR